MNSITRFFHELLNPHCIHCAEIELVLKEAEIEAKTCMNCEVLRQQLHTMNADKDKLLNALLEKTRPEVQEPVNVSELKPIVTNSYVPFAVRRQALERESRENAKILKRQTTKTNVDKLENEVLGQVNGPIS